MPPKKQFTHLMSRLGRPNQLKRILITAGGTRETIDGVRTLTNMSTGQTGARLADELHNRGHHVLLLTNRFAQKPQSKVKVDTYENFNGIYNTLRALGRTHHFDMILHSAAVSDYSIGEIQTPDGVVNPGQEKISSQYKNISIRLERNEKILPKLKDLFHSQTTVVGFKLTSTESKEEQAKAVFELLNKKSVDYVVHNDMGDIKKGKRQFLMTSKQGEQIHLPSVEDLAHHISDILSTAKKTESSNDPVP